MNNNTENSVEAGGNEYRFGKLNAMQQFHVARRLGPALIVAGISVEMLSKGVLAAADDLVAMAGPVVSVISQMPDTEVNYVIHTCMSIVQRRQGDKWARVMTPDNTHFMFDDMDMPVMIKLVIEVLKANLANFLPGLAVGMQSQQNSAAGQPQGGTH
jgi:hypothetical protein